MADNRLGAGRRPVFFITGIIILRTGAFSLHETRNVYDEIGFEKRVTDK